MRKIKNGLILSGGDGSRFWPLSNKSLFDFLGKPLIVYQVEQLAKYCDLISVVVNKDNATAIKRLLDNYQEEFKYQIITQKDDYQGQAGAIFSVKNIVKGEVFIVNANDLLNYDQILPKITDFSYKNNQLVLFAKKINEYFPGGYLRLNKDNQMVEVVEKPGKDNMPSPYAKLVLDYYSDIALLIQSIESTKDIDDNHYELSINNLLKGNISRQYYIYDGSWQTIKYSWHVLTMMKEQLNTIKKSKISLSSKISKKAIIQGPVIIGDNVKIGDYVKILGPVYIGDNSVIGDYSLLRESHIGVDCLIGSYCEIARSYINNNVFLHRNYVGDSVLDNDVMMGAQAVTANFRFDSSSIMSDYDEDKVDTGLMKLGLIAGEKTKIGINASTLPGIKIGKNCLIGPGEVVRFDLEDNTYLIKGEERNNLKS